MLTKKDLIKLKRAERPFFICYNQPSFKRSTTLKKLLILTFTFIFISNQSLAEQPTKPYGLQFTEMYSKQVLVKSYTQQLKGRIFELHPEFKEQEQDVEKWLSTLFTSGKFNLLLALHYKKIFTEQEFKELLNFYKSDTGKKFMKMAPQMSAISADVAGKMMQNSLFAFLDSPWLF